MNSNYIIKICWALVLCFSIQQLSAQDYDLDYYLPKTKYDNKIPTPESYLGYQVGEWHISHDQVIGYFKALAQASDRIEVTEYARSHEQRRLIYASITSKKNRSNIDEIKAKHAQLTMVEKSREVNIDQLPGVIYQGYSIHGNEPSGVQAAVLMAYWLTAGLSPLVQETLDQLVILIDPCMNPDGYQRFSTWVNSHKHSHLVSDPSSRELNEHWPKGRTNHYWFDLNRDWLLLSHPESRGRVRNFNEWNPMVLTDHHEMGTNSTFFFQPGVPSRTNPLTQQINQDLTEEMGEYHAEALDQIGSEYFTKERFDDFYYGKGSTFPDVQGCVGILFEQASSRGHLQDSANGVLSFPFTIRNQVVTSLSTQKASMQMRDKLLSNKRNFYRDAYELSLKFPTKAYSIKIDDPIKINKMLDIFSAQQIQFYNDLDGNSILVPTQQRQHKLIRSIFEPRISFTDSVFYDVSTWTFPEAFDVEVDHVSSQAELTSRLGEEIRSIPTNLDYEFNYGKDYYFEWKQYNAPAFLYKLFDFTDQISKGNLKQDNGNKAIIHFGDVTDMDNVVKLAKKWEVQIHSAKAVKSKLTLSDSLLKQPKIAMLVGLGVDSYEAGAQWFQLDQRWDIPVVMIDKLNMRDAKLDKYDVLILPNGRYNKGLFNHDKIKEWTSKGGSLLAMRSAIEFVRKQDWIKLDIKNSARMEQAAKDNVTIAKSPGDVLGGSIYATDVNADHPLSFGFEREQYPVFKRGTQFYLKPVNKNSIGLSYPANARLSGYSTDEHIERANDAVALMAFKLDKGNIITMVDNPNFRGFWYGGSMLFANSLFFGPGLETSFLQE